MSTQSASSLPQSPVLSPLQLYRVEQHASESKQIKVECNGVIWKVNLPQDSIYNCHFCQNAPALKNFCNDLSHNYCVNCFDEFTKGENLACPTCPPTTRFNIQDRSAINEHLHKCLQQLLVECIDCGEKIEFKLAPQHNQQKQHSSMHREFTKPDDTELSGQLEGFGLDMTASFQMTPSVIEEARSLELANELIAIDKAQDKSVAQEDFTRQVSEPINIPTASDTTKIVPSQDNTHSQIRSPAIRSISSEDKPSSSLEQTSSDNSGSHDTAGIEQWLGSEELIVETNSTIPTPEQSIQTEPEDLSCLRGYDVVQQDLEAPSSITEPNTDKVGEDGSEDGSEDRIEDGGWTMIDTNKYYKKSS
ncbi:MAG: hypothetical protein HAW66_10000 [Shewanella sp.]|nr:hypothetical protein [Shewanella sp.]